MLERKKNKSLSSYMCLAAAILALGTSIIFLLTQKTAAPLGHTGSFPGMILLTGAVISIVMFFVPVRFGALIQAAMYNVALYFVVVQLYLVFADVINHVTYAGGNPNLCVFYMVATFVSAVLCVVASFMKQPEEKVDLKKDIIKGSAFVAAACVSIFCFSRIDLISSSRHSDSKSLSAKVAMKYADNKFASMSIEELTKTSRAEWEAKKDLAYFFEGQYTEGFSTIVDPACLDMYCAKDGSMYGSFSGPVTSVGMGSVMYVYGYWYNVDANGEKNFVVHITGTQDPKTGVTRAVNVEGGEDADVYIFDTNHGAYNYEASLSFGVFGGMITRNINIYGMPYTETKTLEIDSSAIRTFYTGDFFDSSELVVTTVRANGSEESIWNGRLSYSGFDSAATGTKKVTGTFLGKSQSFEVKVETLVTENFTGTYELVAGSDPVAMDANLLIDYSHKVIKISSANGMASVSGVIVGVTDNIVTASINGSQPVEIVLSGDEGARSAVIPAHEEVVAGWFGNSVYSISKSSFGPQK